MYWSVQKRENAVLFETSRFVFIHHSICLFFTDHYICLFPEIFGVQIEHLFMFMFIVQKFQIFGVQIETVCKGWICTSVVCFHGPNYQC
jgi:hypothetical protein